MTLGPSYEKYPDISNTSDSSQKGKAVEYAVLGKLLKADFEVFMPTVDKGIDFILRNDEGAYIELQVKSRTIRDPENTFKIKEFTAKNNFFIICYNLVTDDFYVIASQLFERLAEERTNGKKKEYHINFSELDKRFYYKNETGLRLLKKALKEKNNKVNAFFK